MKIQVHNPCHENWDKMTPTEKGRHCALCQKEVVDFRAMTDAEVKQYFQKTAGKVCGSFRPDQINRTLVNTKPTTSLLWARVWLSVGLFFTWAGKAESQEARIEPVEISPTQYKNLPTQYAQTNDFVVSGNVIDKKSNSPVAVEVRLTDIEGKVLTSTLSSESTGSFELRLPEGQLPKRMHIVVIQNGMPTNSFSIKPKKGKKELKKELRIEYLPETMQILGEPAIDE